MDSHLAADTTVTVTAGYTENGVTKTAQQVVTLKVATAATACEGATPNQSGLTIAGNTRKTGDSLEVNYCLKNFNHSTKFDVYVAVQLPDETLLFMQAVGFFGSPSFTDKIVPYMANALIPDKAGPVLSMPELPMTLPTGTYTFYAIPVLAGKDVMNFTNHIGNLAKSPVTLSSR